MSVSNYTNNVMKALPASLRPNPHYIDEYVNKAVAKGWTPTKLAETSFMNRQGMNPALVATNIKNLSEHEPEAIKKQHHAPITYPANPVPMPEWFKDQWGAMKATRGAMSTPPTRDYPTTGVA
jgi:hypothetical protein